MNEFMRSSFAKFVALFLLGFIGVISLLPVISDLVAMQPEKPPVPIGILQFISAVQSSVLLLMAVWVGMRLTPKVALSSPVIDAALSRAISIQLLRPVVVYGVMGGVIGGGFIYFFTEFMSTKLPAEFIATAQQITLPWYSKILYGGITEEVLIRWGLMSFLVWLFARTQIKQQATPRTVSYVLAIIVSALIFGVGHLPFAAAFSPDMGLELIVYIIVGNVGFGLIAGYLFWRRGLECAIAAHIVAHILMLSLGM